jgi:hypothetical protein
MPLPVEDFLLPKLEVPCSISKLDFTLPAGTLELLALPLSPTFPLLSAPACKLPKDSFENLIERTFFPAVFL